MKKANTKVVEVKESNKKSSKLKIAIWSFLMLIFFGLSIYCLFFWNWKKQKQQSEEEALAADWLAYVISATEPLSEVAEETTAKDTDTGITPSQADNEEIITTETSEIETETADVYVEETVIDDEKVYQHYINDVFSYLDEYYFSRGGVVYTPNYAQGVFTGVIYYEKGGLAREVFTARNNAEANANLDMWIPTIVNPRALVGWSAFCIKLHNHTQTKISGNELGKAQIGDRLYFLTTTSIYTYEVTDIYRMSRDLVEKTLDNDPCGYPNTKMFLATCGRDDNFMVQREKYLPSGTAYTSPYDIRELDLGQPTTSRYMDFIVEADLIDVVPITDNEFAASLVEKIKKKSEADKPF